MTKTTIGTSTSIELTLLRGCVFGLRSFYNQSVDALLSGWRTFKRLAGSVVTRQNIPLENVKKKNWRCRKENTIIMMRGVRRTCQRGIQEEITGNHRSFVETTPKTRNGQIEGTDHATFPLHKVCCIVQVNKHIVAKKHDPIPTTK